MTSNPRDTTSPKTSRRRNGQQRIPTIPTSVYGRLTRWPWITTAPTVAGTNPAMNISRVLLPQPEGPTMETNSRAPA